MPITMTFILASADARGSAIGGVTNGPPKSTSLAKF